MWETTVKKGTSQLILPVFIQDTSAALYPLGLTGLTSGSGSLTCYYIRDTEIASTAITLSAGSIGAWSKGGFVEVDSSNMPGLYELGVPNECVRTGASRVVICLQGAANMGDTFLVLRLVDYLETDTYGVLTGYSDLRTNLGLTRIDRDIHLLRLAVEDLQRRT